MRFRFDGKAQTWICLEAISIYSDKICEKLKIKMHKATKNCEFRALNIDFISFVFRSHWLPDESISWRLRFCSIIILHITNLYVTLTYATAA